MPDLRHTDIQYLHGVGPKRAELLRKELGISTYYDLLYYFPFRYIDRSVINHVNELHGDEAAIQLRGRFLTFTTAGEGRKRRLQALFTDGTGTIEVVWFNRVASIQKSYNTATEYILFGKPSLFNNRINIVHPEVDLANAEVAAQGLQGVYNLTEVLRNRSFTSRAIHKLVVNVLNTPAVQHIDETLPPELMQRYHLMPLAEALRNIHQPADQQALQRAQLRLKFEELFFLELNILHYIKGSSRRLVGHVFGRVGAYFHDFYNNILQFPLTGAQKRVIREMRQDMGSGKQMNRLLQGDVGSGKTLVAAALCWLCRESGYVSAFMAPTEILAEQHFQTLSGLLAPFGMRIGRLNGAMSAKEKREAKAAIAAGDYDLVVGTHALFSEDVVYSRLGLIITDEQHRFGVKQRSALIGKGEKPHVLVMSATPIPRTLALMIYGDLDVSIIDELPPGRQKVDTFAVDESYRTRLNGFIRKLVGEGRQVFVVCPKVEDDEDEETPGDKKLKSAEEHAKELAREFPELSVGCVHGRMKPKDKDAVMAAFVRGEIDILVATTVIEVGVDVPNAALMIIENAERFGLSQLHQLRGRVGRGQHKSWCILVSDNKGEEVKARLSIMSKTNNGFEISEEDLRLRGPGDFFGSRQHGLPEMHVADLGADTQIMKTAQDEAKALLAADPQLSLPEHSALRERIETLFNNNTDSFN